MLDTFEANPRAITGGNNPPEPTPYERAVKAVEDIFAETTLWLDGHAIDSQEMADGVGNLLTEIRKAEKLAEAARVAEKTPHDEAVKEIQSRYAPLIADTKAMKGKTVLAAEACKNALQPWLDAEDRRIREDARIAREEADRQREAAEDALRASDAQNLAERAAAEELLAASKRADTAANVASRQTAKAGGAFGRAAALRTAHVPTLTDPVIAIRHYWKETHAEVLAFLIGLAERDVRNGKRTIPGFVINEEKRAV